MQHPAQDGGRLELAGGIKREAGRARVEHHTPAREVLVLVPGDQGREAASGQARGAEPAPALPDLVVPARVGQVVAVRLGRGKPGGVEDEPQRPVPIRHAPDNAHAGQGVHAQRDGKRTRAVAAGFRGEPRCHRLLYALICHVPGQAAFPHVTQTMAGQCVRSGRGSDGAAPQPARECLFRHPTSRDRDEHGHELRRARGNLAAVGT